MKQLTLYLPEKVVESLEKLMEKGLFPNKGNAIRYFIITSLSNYVDLLSKPASVNTVNSAGKAENKGMKIVSFKASQAMLDYMDYIAKEIGFNYRAEFIRAAILKFIENLQKDGKE